MKLLILDVDGVLNSNSTFKYLHDKYKSWPTCTPGRKHVKLLDEIIKKTDAKIVISSTWRLHSRETFMWGHLFRALGAYEIPHAIIGFTPIVITDNQRYRGIEIKSWIENLPKYLEVKNDLDHDDKLHDLYEGFRIDRINPEIESLCILDDDSDMKPYMDKLVKCSSDRGLTKKEMNLCVEMLNEKRFI